MATPVLEVTHLKKVYGTFTAVNDISFSINEGEVVGFLGPNGAGKTTTIQMLLNLVTPTSGTISYFGKRFDTHREESLSKINTASAYSNLQVRMTVKQNLLVYAGLYNIPHPEERIAELLQLLEIEQLATELHWHLSSGQKTRVFLAKALLNRPKLLLLDEPTASLDPDIAHKVLEIVRMLKEKEHIGVLYTSHKMEEVTRICDRVIFLDHGNIVAEDTPLGLTKMIGGATLTLTFDATQKEIEAYLKKKKLTYRFPQKHVVAIDVPEKDIAGVLFGFAKEKIWITEINVEKPGLEEVFLQIAAGRAHAFSQS